MSRTTLLLLGITAACGNLLAQSNERGAGYDGALTDISSATDWGRRGPAYPGGEVGVSFRNQLCNPGNVPIEWRTPGGGIGSVIQTDHPKFGFLVARELGGRFVQISDWSYVKHAFYALASPSTCGGTCQPPAVAGTQLGVSCSDVYSADNNANRQYLGPPSEINPWLGTYNINLAATTASAVGSYFDIGDPAQSGYPAAADGIKSLSTSGFDAVKNRVTIREADIPSGGTMYFQVHVIHEGERVENRANNVMSRPFSMTWVGGAGTSAWSSTTTGTATLGSILNRWPGAAISWGSNGGTGTLTDADGRFLVAVKTSGPVNGFWHYEYVVQNLDNNRGGGSFRIPLCGGARVQNLGFRDIDQNPLNDWTATVGSNEIAWTSNGTNPLNWNTLYNFWFDCDVAPAAGNVLIDQARIGPGSLSVSVPTTLPGLQTAIDLGGACGTPAVTLVANDLPTAGNTAFQVDVTSDPYTLFALLYSPTTVSVPLGGSCTLITDLSNYLVWNFYITDDTGAGVIPLPVPPGQTPIEAYFQALTLIPNPPVLGLFGLSNGIKLRGASTGCD